MDIFIDWLHKQIHKSDINYCNSENNEMIQIEILSTPIEVLIDIISDLDENDKSILLGKGATAKVYLTTLGNLIGDNNMKNDCLIVVKQFFTKMVNWADNEINSLKKLRGYTSVPYLFDAIKTKKTALIFMEYVNGLTIDELGKKIKKDHIIEPIYQKNKINFIIYIITLIVETIETLHKYDIAHKDLNLNNIMLIFSGSDIMIKFIDFGSSCNMLQEGNGCYTTDGVTPLVMSSHLCKGKNIYAHDYWCIILVIYYLYHLNYPTYRSNVSQYNSCKNISNPNYLSSTYFVPNEKLTNIQMSIINNDRNLLWQILSSA